MYFVFACWFFLILFLLAMFHQEFVSHLRQSPSLLYTLSNRIVHCCHHSYTSLCKGATYLKCLAIDVAVFHTWTKHAAICIPKLIRQNIAPHNSYIYINIKCFRRCSIGISSFWLQNDIDTRNRLHIQTTDGTK